MDCSMPGLPVHHQLLMSVESVMPSNHVILCHPLLLLPSIFPNIRVFSNESALCIRWPSIWVSTSASVLPMNIQDWFLLGRTGWISLQSKGLSRVFSNSSNASVLRCSAFFMVHLSHLYMTTGKTIALTRRTFVGKVVSLLFNMLSRFVTAFLPRSKHLWISWLQSPPAVILEPKKRKSATVCSLFPHLLLFRMNIYHPETVKCYFFRFFNQLDFTLKAECVMQVVPICTVGIPAQATC